MLKKFLLAIILLPFLILLGLYATGNGFFVNAIERTYLKGHTTANINDAEAFNVATIEAGIPQPLQPNSLFNGVPLSEELQARLESNNTAAYLVLHRGGIVSEQYFGDYDEFSRTNSFSMAKTVLTLLVGVAIEEGIIESFDQPITELLPEFGGDPLGQQATLKQLSLMNSGYDWVEHYYSWFSPTVQLYHGSDVEDFLLDRPFSDPPGERWYYSSASTQLLAIALVRALRANGREPSIANYFSEKLWQPMGMNDEAVWHTDNEGMELAFCCINSNARNFAKLGQLMLQNGEWAGQQLVPESFIKQMIQPLGTEFYGLSTWLNYENDPPFYHFSGHLGQSIVVVPEHKLVIVRTGERRDKSRDLKTVEIPNYIQEALRSIGRG